MFCLPGSFVLLPYFSSSEPGSAPRPPSTATTTTTATTDQLSHRISVPPYSQCNPPGPPCVVFTSPPAQVQAKTLPSTPPDLNSSGVTHIFQTAPCSGVSFWVLKHLPKQQQMFCELLNSFKEFANKLCFYELLQSLLFMLSNTSFGIRVVNGLWYSNNIWLRQNCVYVVIT